MPLSPPTLVATLIPAFAGAGIIGTGMPQLAQAVANGVVLWAATATVTTVDTGTLGVGEGVAPLIVPFNLLYTNFSIAFAAQSILGVMAPLEILGLAVGLSEGFEEALLLTTHPLVGAGAGVAKVSGTAIPSMISAFSSAGMTGTAGTKHATAIGMGIDLIFNELVFPTPIIGPPSISPSAGVGTGNIV